MRAQYEVWAPIGSSRRNPVSPTPSPTDIGITGPRRPVMWPASHESTNVVLKSGRKARPVSSAE
jgi:hypothetical protein